jgi:hypothetical protein
LHPVAGNISFRSCPGGPNGYAAFTVTIKFLPLSILLVRIVSSGGVPAEEPQTAAASVEEAASETAAREARNIAMAGAIEFSNIPIFEREMDRMPNFALHELAHALEITRP